MKTLVIAALAVFYVAICVALSIPMGLGGTSLFARIYEDGNATFKMLAIVIALIPIMLAFVLFRREAEIARWSFERTTLARDIARLMQVLKGLGEGQKGLAKGVYDAAQTDIAGEAEKLAVSVSGSEAQLASLEVIVGRIPDIEKLLQEVAGRQAALADRLSRLRDKQAPLVASLAALNTTKAGIAEVMTALEKQGGVGKIDDTIAEAVRLLESSEPTVSRLATLYSKAEAAKTGLGGLRDRLAPILDKQTGLAAHIAALTTLRDQLASSLSGLARDGDIAVKVEGVMSFLTSSALRLKAAEDALPRISAARLAAERQKAALSPLEDEDTGLHAELEHLERAVEQIRESLANVEKDGNGVPLRVRLDQIDAMRTQLESRVSAVEEQARRLVGLSGGMQQLDRKVNGTGAMT